MEALGWAKSRAWHHHGIAWKHLEQASRDELVAEALAVLSSQDANQLSDKQIPEK